MENLGISRQLIDSLTRVHGENLVSIYLPTARKGVDVLKGPIALRNILAAAEQQLIESGMRPTLARDYLAKAQLLSYDADFWAKRSDSIAIFIGPETFEAVHMSFGVPEVFGIGNRFNILPLIPLLAKCDSFYALALDKNEVRLIHCTPETATEVEVPMMPKSMEEFIAFDHPEKHAQAHMGGAPGRTGSFIQHGAGDRGVDPKERLNRFCIEIDHAVTKFLNSGNKPLVLAGTEEVQSAYRSVDKYKKLVPVGITQSLKTLKLEDIRNRSQEIADAYLDAPRQEAVGRFKALGGTGLASLQPEEILASAQDGRVDILFTSQPSETPWSLAGGHAADHDIESLEKANRNNELANLAALATLSSHGKVFRVFPDEIRVEGPVAAIYRY